MEAQWTHLDTPLHTSKSKVINWPADIPSCFMQDYHLVGGTSKLLEEFHREHNKDADARCTAWEPAIFSAAPDATKHRTVEFASQMKAPGWLLKIIGFHTPPVLCKSAVHP